MGKQVPLSLKNRCSNAKHISIVQKQQKKAVSNKRCEYLILKMKDCFDVDTFVIRFETLD